MTHRFQINLRGMIDLLSDHLYSKPDVFVRELLQNGVDAITARRQVEPDHLGEITLSVTAPKGKPPTLEMLDDGIGLTEDDLHRFLATIGQTSKRDATGARTGDFLGQFGIGLLSGFVVSDEIVVVSRSIKEGSPAVEWRAKGDGTYSVRTLDADLAAGTRVYLTCRPGKEEYFGVEKIKDLAFHYGALLPYPIRVSSGGRTGSVINRGAPWRSKGSNAKAQAQALLKFGKQVFEVDFLDAIPLRSEAGKVDGVAYVLPHPANLNGPRGHRVYLRNMLLSDDADNLLPDWAFFVRAIVNADDLRPTAAREGFYEDKKLERARDELGRCLRDHLVAMAERDSGRFERFIGVHHLAFKALAAQDDECFRMFVDWLPFETNQGRQTLRALYEQDPTIRYADDVADYQQMARVAAAQGITLVNAGYVYEAEILSRVPEVHPDAILQRVDPSTLTRDLDELDEGEQDAIHPLLDAAVEALRPYGCRPEGRKFGPAELPALFQAEADARFLRSLEQSKESADPMFRGILESLGAGRASGDRTTLVFNWRNPLIRRLGTITQRAALSHAAEVLYVQALMMAHQPLSGREMTLMNQGLAGLLDLLAGGKGAES